MYIKVQILRNVFALLLFSSAIQLAFLDKSVRTKCVFELESRAQTDYNAVISRSVLNT